MPQNSTLSSTNDFENIRMTSMIPRTIRRRHRRHKKSKVYPITMSFHVHLQ